MSGLCSISGSISMKIETKASASELATMTLAALSLLLVIVNAALVVRNQSIQVQATERQQVINQGLQFSRIRQVLAQLLANVSVSKNDHDIAELLTRNGISVTVPPSPAAPQGK